MMRGLRRGAIVVRTAHGTRGSCVRPFDGMVDERFSRRQVLAGGIGAAAALGISRSKLLGAAEKTLRSATRPAGTPNATAVDRVVLVDGLVSPIGLGLSDVVFGWRLPDTRPGARQSAYRLTVTRHDPTGRARSRRVWDSGRVQSAADAFVPYSGRPLSPDTVYGCAVQTWDGSGQPNPTALGGTFETGLDDRDWRASWIRRPANSDLEPDEYTYRANKRRSRRRPSCAPARTCRVTSSTSCG